MKKYLLVASALVIAGFGANVAGSTPKPARPAPSLPLVNDIGASPAGLSVMTYNVEGLPWPVALGRPTALAEIGRRFALLRERGMQPHVVLLQEAFISQAKAIGIAAGYRYVATGPTQWDASVTPTPSLDSGFRAAARWGKGENDGKWVDSGLAILSDYPIVSTAKMAFPQDACAGFDCLAAKGVLLARLNVPGMSRPLIVIDTHLNSRGASGVPVARANAAFAWQTAAVRRFVSAMVDPDANVILGGDFNIGRDPERIALVERDGGILPGGSEAITTTFGSGDHIAGANGDVVAVRDRAKDKEYFRAAKGTQLRLRNVTVPFGIAERGFDLSDHLGFVARFNAG